MKVIISGGGTGGHIYPAIAIADALKKHDTGTEILFVGAKGKMEMHKIPEAGYPIVGLNIRGFQRKKILPNIALPYRVLTSLWKARKLLKDFQPDVVVGTGGYASAPVLYMAAKSRIPTLIQEQNAVPGLANRILARYVDTICVAHTSMEKYFSKANIVLTGNPIREDLMHLDKKREFAFTYFGLKPEKKCLLVLGGSLGAKHLNKSILQALDAFREAGIQVIWATGRLYFDAIKAQLTQQQQHSVKVYSFIKAINLAYAAADIVVSRAGALTVSELCAVPKPVIFVPSPNVAADHQTQNVRALVAKNAALMIKDHEAPRQLTQAVLRLARAEAQQNTLACNIKAWAKPRATVDITGEIIRLSKATIARPTTTH